MFAWAAEGVRYAEIARRLNAQGVPSPARSCNGWSTQTVHKVITRTTYYGVDHFGRTRWRRLNSERDRQAGRKRISSDVASRRPAFLRK
jgi:hypothetical protein